MAQTGQVGGRDSLDTNATNRPSAPPSAETVGDTNADTGYIPQAGRAVTNAYNSPAAPPEVYDETYSNSTGTNVVYPSGPISNNRIKSSTNTKVGL